METVYLSDFIAIKGDEKLMHLRHNFNGDLLQYVPNGVSFLIKKSWGGRRDCEEVNVICDEPVKHYEWNGPRFVPTKKHALDGRLWWVVFDKKECDYSTCIYFGKYRSKKDCQFAIDWALKNYFN